MALPFPENRFDAAFMALVIFFVPDPAKSVAEMARVVRPGGTVAAYAWDMVGGVSPLEPIDAEIRALNQSTSRAPNPGASRIEALHALWAGAGLEAIETRETPAHRSFTDFDEFWTVTLPGSGVGQSVAALSASDAELVKNRVRANLPRDAAGRISYGARANAIKGRVPG